jgi:hypothetical protein
VHFEIHADSPERAAAFYEGVFGWKFQKWSGPMEYWLVMTGEAGQPGINGGMIRRMGPPPEEGAAVNAYPCTMEVASLEDACKKVEAGGGRIVVPKMAIPGMAWLVYCKDTEGNIFGMIENDPNAK